MGQFSNNKTPWEIGFDLATRLFNEIKTIPSALDTLTGDDSLPMNLDDIDIDKVSLELSILVFVGQRLALQHIHLKDGDRKQMERRKQISDALDHHAVELFGTDPEINSLLDKRGEQYFSILQSHNMVGSGMNWDRFHKELQFTFEQFCRGAYDLSGPTTIGGFCSTMPLWLLAVEYWKSGFGKTAEYIVEAGI